jgi:PAS domain S-box-containing protein
MATPIRLLIVEDSEEDAELLVAKLRREQFDPHWERVETEEAYLQRLSPELDIIISDFTMPCFDGMRALDLMRSRGYDIPFIIVSGTLGEERAVEALKRGALDYLIKGRTERLGSAVSRALELSRSRRRQTQDARSIEEGERKFRTLFDAAHDAIYILENGLFVDCNARGQFMYGRTWDQIVGHSPDEFAPELQPDGRPSREKAIEIVTHAMGGESQTFEWATVHRDGSIVLSEVSLNRVELAGRVQLMAISRDITERRRAEEQILEQAELLDKATDAIVVCDLHGKILFWNKGAERMYGWPREEIIGRNLSENLYRKQATFMEIIDAVIANGEASGEVDFTTLEDRELTADVRWTLLCDKYNAPRAVLAIHTDVTEKRMIESQLMRAQRMESIGTLAGGIAHDLNNILTPILTSIEILKLTETEDRARKVLETIERSARRGADIVRQVLSFARGIQGKRVEIQPKRLLSDIGTLITDTFPKHISLQMALRKSDWPILGDPTLLHQVLLNLSVNARDAMPQGGLLTITADNVVVDERSAKAYDRGKPGKYVVISVGDSGDGIPDKIRDKIFEPFFTTKEVGKGTGLGLATVLTIVKSHNGFIDVQRNGDSGTVFKVFLPTVETPHPKPPESESLSTMPRGNGETILVVDDEPSILAITGDTLETFGYRVLEAHDGAEALALYQKHQDEIAVVLTDLTMPIMDGNSTIRELLRRNPAVKIIASSGFKTGQTGPVYLPTPGRLFLAKPYTAESLLKTVRRILDEPADTPHRA